MKKVFLSIAALSCLFLGAKAETRWGVVAGANYNQIHMMQQDIFPTSRMVGGNAGITGELMVPGVGFGVDASILYSMRNGKLDMGAKRAWASQGIGEETCMLHYIDIPFNLKFRYHNLNGFESTVMPMAFAGPVISILAGHNKCADALGYKKVSACFQMGIGAEILQKVQVKLGYQFSMGESIHTRLLEENIGKNRTFFCNATYFF